MNLAAALPVNLLPYSSLNRRTAFPSVHFHDRAFKRRRLNPRCQANPSPLIFESFFDVFLSQFPSVNNLSYIAPALGFASGIALYFSSKSPKLLQDSKDVRDFDYDFGEWILFCSPTPFNRFVILRCPSICFTGNELLENVNEKLVKEDSHFVTLNCGRMVHGDTEDHFEGNLMYQRVCVSMEDGGVLSLDWPANLELEAERGLDTTVLIIPATCEGSNEGKIKKFVHECLGRGVFPVVMNPRGCAGSPLTSPRLFTAADSDDVSTAVQFVHTKRPWSTFMGVGWGYGANMLTKYLADFGERTPLIAATCIDNPFDLEEATMFSIFDNTVGQSLTDGLISILQCNKELFQGPGKGFDVKRALSASSIRDFDEAISMVSYGSVTIQDFYKKCSTRNVIWKVKIPVLFIQNNDKNVPQFSIPRGMIAENPCTSLLLCSSFPPIRNNGSAFSWCHNLILEWLTAVELGLLKGRHPLLEYVDVAINPSQGLALTSGDSASKSDSKDNLSNLTNGYAAAKSLSEKDKTYDTIEDIQLRPSQDVSMLLLEIEGLHREGNDAEHQINAEVEEKEEANLSENERGHVVQTAELLMNMLDATAHDILSEEQKKKVLHSVGKGEKLMNALQDAVPEDARENLVKSVSGIVQTQGSNLQFDGLLRLGLIPDVASGLYSKVSKASGDDIDSSDLNKRKSEHGDGSAVVIGSSNEHQGTTGSVKQMPENSEKSNNLSFNQSAVNNLSYNALSEKDDQSGNNFEIKQSLKSDLVENSDSSGDVSENVNVELLKQSEEAGVTYFPPSDSKNIEKEHVNGESDLTEKKSENNAFSTDPSKVTEASQSGDHPSASCSSTETKPMENKAENNKRTVEKNSHVSSQTSSASPDFSISRAFDALAGFDDSTQVAVKGVFQVIEDMIDQMEMNKENENQANEKGNKNQSEDGSNEQNYNGWDEVNNLKEGYAQPEDHCGESWRMGDLRGIPFSSVNSNGFSEGTSEESKLLDVNERHNFLANTKKSQFATILNMIKNSNNISETFGQLSAFPYGDPLYKEYLNSYLLSKMRKNEKVYSDKQSALYLDYSPEEGQWKFLEQLEDSSASDEELIADMGSRKDQIDVNSISKHSSDIVEPSSVMMDSGERHKENEVAKMAPEHINFEKRNLDESILYVKNLIVESLNIDVARRLNAADIEELETGLVSDIEYVANAVSLALTHEKEHVIELDGHTAETLESIHGDNVIGAISIATRETQYLNKVLPLGVIVGSSLSALGKFFNNFVLDSNSNIEKDENSYHIKDTGKNCPLLSQRNKINERPLKDITDNVTFDNSMSNEGKIDLQGSNKKKAMVGAFTAALGASALLIHKKNSQTGGTLMGPFKVEEKIKKPSIIDEMRQKNQSNIVTSLAEKALSVASPVMPTTEDGEVDQDRLVNMLAELGQKGGFLKLVGKIALLWGGICGAMSLTDKLISFLRISERPLLQRVLGFIFMVLLLWSPVIVPLFPSLMQSWTTQNSSEIVELVCIGGLYLSVVIMIILWGKRIRKYDDPVVQYGLDFSSIPRFQIFLTGVAGGSMLVLLIHLVNSLFGCVQFCWPTTMSCSQSEPVKLIKTCAHMFFVTVQGIATATGVATVEELLFRSWLPQEIATDIGYHQGIIISGLAFSLSQRSIWEIPGLWLLSLSLSGTCQRSQGSLALPIGMRTGIITCSFILKAGGFLKHGLNLPIWLTGGHPCKPFSGVVGLAFTLILAILLYPRQLDHKMKVARTIRN